MKKLLADFVSLIPQIIAGVLSGMLLLIIEYRTGWFANHIPFINRANSNLKRKPIDLEFILVGFMLLIGVITFSVFFIPFIGIMIRPFFVEGTVLDNPDDSNVMVQTIDLNNSKSFFDNELFISIEKISIQPPDTPIVSFTLGSPGTPNIVVENAVNGHSVIYETTNYNYDIRLTSVDPNLLLSKADFTISRLQK